MSEKDRSFVIRVIVSVLAIASLAVVFALLVGLWEPRVDNNRIFQILTPISNNITGALISLLSALAGYQAGNKNKGDKDE